MISKLNLPEYKFKFKKINDKVNIFDVFRKKYVILTPEEWVRQNFLRYITEEKKYPQSLTGVEISLKVGRLQKRADIVIYDKNAKPYIVVECKAPSVKITEETCRQALIYNTTFDAKYIILTNGLTHFCMMKNQQDKSYKFIEGIPEC